MSEKKKHGGEILDVDISSFEMEIDKEIDSLFTIESLTTPETSTPALEPGKDLGGATMARGDGGDSTKTSSSTPGKQVNVDAGSFQLQIEKEIDALFVPSEIGPSMETAFPEQGKGGRGANDKGRLVDAVPPAGPGSSAKPFFDQSVSDDLSSFEKELDAGIDSLFKPVGQSSRDEPTTWRDKERPADRFAMGTAPPAASAFSTGRETGEISHGALGGSSAGSRESDAIPSSEKPQGLSSLLESFSIAYLSLEWDFSAENIAKFDNVVGLMEPYCQGDPSIQSLHKLLKSVLNRLKTKPDSISAGLSEIIHDSQDLLRSVLISERVRPEDKEQLKGIVRKFHALREKSITESRPDGGKTMVGEPVLGPEVAVASSRAVTEKGATPDLPMLRSLLERMETCRVVTDEAVQRISGESKRLQQIEGILAKTPALDPLKARVARIRSNLDVQVSLVLNKSVDWRERMVQAQELLKDTEEYSFQPPAQVMAIPLDQTEAVRSDASPAAPWRGTAPPAIRQDDVCLFDVSGKHLAVLASQVVKVQKISGGTARKLIKRGYATLADFKPMFRSVKTGVFGTWSGMPDRILGKYRFVPVLPDVLGVESLPAKGGALLISSGRNHGLIFIDTAAVDLHNEREILLNEPKRPGILGVIKSETGEPFEVLNLDAILKKQ